MARFPSSVAAAVLVATLACSADTPVEPAGASHQLGIAASVQSAPAYEMVDLGVAAGGFPPGVIDKAGRVHTISGDRVLRWESGTITDLGALPGPGMRILSPGGLVAGMVCNLPNGACTFYLFNEGEVTTLESGGVALEEGTRIQEVRDDGTVVALVEYHEPPTGSRFAGVVWHKGVHTELPDLDGAPFTNPVTINKHNQVGGQSIGPFGRSRAYFWEDGVARDLGGLFDQPCTSEPSRMCGHATVSAINDHGDAVGFSSGEHNSSRAVIWPDGGAPQDLGVFPGEFTSARTINDAGDILGSGFNKWFAIVAGVVYAPAAPDGSFPAAMNGRGEIVGTFRTADGTFHAFIWRQGQMTDLGAPAGSTFARATSINDRGEVIGSYLTPQFQQRLLLWRPVKDDAVATVP